LKRQDRVIPGCFDCERHKGFLAAYLLAYGPLYSQFR
jgi:hypothetical protein